MSTIAPHDQYQGNLYSTYINTRAILADRSLFESHNLYDKLNGK